MKVLFAFDNSECAQRALDDLFKAGFPDDTEVCVLSVIEHWLPPPSALEMVTHLDHDQEYLAVARRAAFQIQEARPSWNVSSEVRAGSPANAILQHAEEWPADLIVVGSHSRTTVGRFFFGSVSQKVLHAAKCPVRIARGQVDEPDAVLRLVIGIDGSPSAEAALQAVLHRTWPANTQVRLVTAKWTIPPSLPNQAMGPITTWVLEENARIQAAIDNALLRLQAAGLQAEAVQKDAVPQQLIYEEAETWDADCIFVGAHGMNALERFMIGSVSSAIAARAHCSVEIVR